MERSLEDRLNAALEGSPFWRRETEEGFEMGRGEGEPEASIVFRYGEWTVYTPDAHAHFDEFEDALSLLVLLLCGEARTVTEYRGEKLAATWIEERVDDEVYEAIHEADFLSPFEAEEWTLWPGERWRTVRKTIGPEGVTSFERVSETSSSTGPTMLPALEGVLGTLEEGLRWAVDGHSRFVYPAPRGWRRQVDDERPNDDSHNLTDFVTTNSEILYRKRCYFRALNSPAEPSDRQTFRPLSIEPGLKYSEPVPEGWSRAAWTLMFAAGRQEMMGIVEIFYTEGTRSMAEALQEALERCLPRARYVPGAWTMHPED